MRTRLCGAILVCMLAIWVVGCTPPAPTTPPATLVKDTTTYNNPNNPFLQPIGDLQPVENSNDYISHLVQVTSHCAWWTYDWSVPVFYADSSHAPQDVNIQNTNVFHGQRIPSWTRGCVGSDGHAYVLNTVEGCAQHYWGFNTGIWNWYPSAFGAMAQPKDFDGTWRAQGGMPSRHAPTASGLVGGGVWPDELTSVIPRAQTFVVPRKHNRGYVDPANACDGDGTCQWDMAQGFRIQMKPSYDVSSLYTFERVYAQALKTYGAFLSDSNGDNGPMAFSSLPSKLSCVNNPFVGLFPDCTFNETATDIILRYDRSQFQVLPFGPLQTAPRLNGYSTYCGTYDNTPIELAAPTLSSISPSTGPAGTTVTLTGTNLTGSYHALFGTADAWNPTVVSATQVRCTVPAGSGTVAVKVRTGGGTSGTVNFTYGAGGTPPTLSSIAPTSGTTAGGTACTLTGTYLTGCSAVSFGGTAATGISVVSATQVRCTSPAKSAGAISVTATTSYGTSNGVNYTFVTPTPTLSSITPTSGTTSGGTACTLTGTNLTGCSAVSFGGTAATSVNVLSSTQVTCLSPAKTAGGISVTATTPGGTSNGVSYTYTAGGSGYTTTLNPIDDAFVFNGEANTVHDLTNMVVQKNYSVDWRPFLKFDMTGVQGTTVTFAKLRLYWPNPNAQTLKVYSCATDTWTEETLTWNNKPADGTQQASFALTGTVAWYDVTLTSYVNSEFTGNKLVTFVIRDDAPGNGNNVNSQCCSKESGGTTYKPQLVLITQ